MALCWWRIRRWLISFHAPSPVELSNIFLKSCRRRSPCTHWSAVAASCNLIRTWFKVEIWRGIMRVDWLMFTRWNSSDSWIDQPWDQNPALCQGTIHVVRRSAKAPLPLSARWCHPWWMKINVFEKQNRTIWSEIKWKIRTKFIFTILEWCRAYRSLAKTWGIWQYRHKKVDSRIFVEAFESVLKQSNLTFICHHDWCKISNWANSIICREVGMRMEGDMQDLRLIPPSWSGCVVHPCSMVSVKQGTLANLHHSPLKCCPYSIKCMFQLEISQVVRLGWIPFPLFDSLSYIQGKYTQPAGLQTYVQCGVRWVFLPSWYFAKYIHACM